MRANYGFPFLLKYDYSFEVSILIEADPSKVREALTDPAMIRQYNSETNVTTDWRVGSSIRWEGSLGMYQYVGEGTVLSFRPGELLEYTYWISISHLKDSPENYQKISYILTKVRNGTKLTISIQDNDPGYETRKHIEWGWTMLANSLKNFVEKKSA
jgi:uncharacterized protein YndB with AHSA1/START domain